ncbi:MAG TPA: CDP-alcohol phosphatidyltransferase family protein [Sumerlaeia bacterium]|nr:CDP-alcohol phosphatidyltransferase family protein [Sumerlaeia bacterium]
MGDKELAGKEEFGGDKKVPLHSPLAKIERRFIDANVPRMPRWIESYHLTLLTIPWSAGLVIFGCLAGRFSLHWLWASSFMLVMQWFTDSFDGSLGKYRNAGLRRWGFYMDHFLDYIFMPCIFVGYCFIVSEPISVYLLLTIGFIYSAMMVNAFLAFGATNRFRITYLGAGPTEIRLYFILINTALIFAGPRFLEVALPYALVVFAVALAIIVCQSHKEIWAIDMEEKKRGNRAPEK